MADISPLGSGAPGPLDRTAFIGQRPLSAGDPLTAGRDVTSAQRGTDRVELSETARYLDQLSALPTVRSERVEEIRRSIAEGTYETEHRLMTALERLAQELQDE